MRTTLRAAVVTVALAGFGLSGAAAAQADGFGWHDSYLHKDKGVSGTSLTTPTLHLTDFDAKESATGKSRGGLFWY